MNQHIFTSDLFGPWVQCFKMQGSGNDFVLLDNRELRLAPSEMAGWARAVCRKAFGMGADGLIFLDKSHDRADVDYFWHFFNADGSRAEMCGNGSRCAARLAFELGLAGKEHALGTDAGPIKAEVFPEQDLAKVQLTPARDLQLNIALTLEEQAFNVHFVNTGVPHLVVFVPDVQSVNIPELGPRFRYHPRFAPGGANVNFVQIVDSGNLLLRTYERGVEGETFACGTGAAASALISHALAHTGVHVQVKTSGQDLLGITIDNDSLFLTGKAMLVFVANLNLRALGLVLPTQP
ncbi:diaminopimelate epimerase [Desulfonatronum thiosulfatophilum]|uniref:Diaminopimelate epimerase n=1 Tax=Desulfonatronum thiosulfatophilum TaxID=617002 RepID=A0A1G6BQ55_9BACT|nr:diaminopimelate epimerase [Desulfonatronum thiosulfatophilum]SDB22749.1 diaminopimelate epimerase [Desulfonatronum thiosulfatophilum]